MRWDRRTEAGPPADGSRSAATDLGGRIAQAGQGIVEYGLRPLAAGSRSVASAIGGLRAQEGQGIVEYGLILSGSALFALIVLVFFGGTLSAVLQAVGNAIDAAT